MFESPDRGLVRGLFLLRHELTTESTEDTEKSASSLPSVTDEVGGEGDASHGFHSVCSVPSVVSCFIFDLFVADDTSDGDLPRQGSALIENDGF